MEEQGAESTVKRMHGRYYVATTRGEVLEYARKVDLESYLAASDLDLVAGIFKGKKLGTQVEQIKNVTVV